MKLPIPSDDHGKIRVFQVPPPGADGLLEKAPQALLTTFGTAALNVDFVDAFDTQALGDMSVADFLRSGYDIALDAADQVLLSDLTGIVVLIMSRATAGQDITLDLAPGVTHVTTCGDGANLSVNAPISSDAAKGVLTPEAAPKVKSDAAMGGRVAMVALVVMFAVFGLMIWIGG